MTMIDASVHRTTPPEGHPAGRQHPGASAPQPGGVHTVFDEIQHALVQQRMTTRLTEAGSERLAKGASADRSGVRRRLGNVLIGLGTAIAGSGDERPVQHLS